MAAGKRWSEDETKAVFALYLMIPSDEIDSNFGVVHEFAVVRGRTNRSVAMKLWNVASLDEDRVRMGKAGLQNAGSVVAWVWGEYARRGDTFLGECMDCLADFFRGNDGGLLTSDSFVTGVLYAVASGGHERMGAIQQVAERHARNLLVG